MMRFTVLSLSMFLAAAGPIQGPLGSFLNLKGQVKAGSEFMAAQQEELTKIQQDPFAVVDPCKNIECPNLVCPAGFVVEMVPSHCCGYCVPTNPALIKDTTDYSTAATEAYATYKTAPYR
eukprot:gnl/MRDRNA2_/MRDRNA2_84265_c0_seq1.p1 gnl/MRDRNA2_/MRDRNA2_84265_c0~~gnl/MRDRNA2_/MRDRNA2_84265_c0_seq1.p1  ORF type:complete len:120 (-),score=29.57 gnl/MRDRNA2_/MRDRNA2_84265_c0_seq1:110-469(-)